jgi:hypothetical protein
MWLTLGLLVALGSVHAGYHYGGEQLQVTVETTECSGDVGIASFNVDRFYKVQSGGCDDPTHPGRKLQQVLVKSRSPDFQYEVLWVTQEEARNLLAQVRNVMNARTGALPGRESVVIAVTPPPTQPEPAPVQPPAQPERTRVPPSAPDVDQRRSQTGPIGPTIEIIDPPIADTRSGRQIVTPTQGDQRLVIGRVRASDGLLALSVNGVAHKIEDGGLFSVTVPISKRKTSVNVVAVDKQGRREAVEFWLVPEDLPATETASQLGPAAMTERGDVFGGYYALIIGNNHYKRFKDLMTASNDAKTLGTLLERRYGFAVTTLTDATRYQILSALGELRKTLTENDNLLIYYAGHGEYDDVNLRGHWLPVDAEADNTANWISTVEVTDSINRMSARHVLIIADSCYSGALTRSAQTELDPGLSEAARQRWLAVIAKARSRTVLTSGGVKPVLDGGGGKHSVFASALIEALTDNRDVLEGYRLYQQVKQRVLERTTALGLKQVPEYAPLKLPDHEFSDFLLVVREDS